MVVRRMGSKEGKEGRREGSRRWKRPPTAVMFGGMEVLVTHTLTPPALRSQRQADLCKFKASLVYKVSFRTARAI